MANYVKFMRGTTAAWNKLPAKDRNSDTLYFIADTDADEGVLYLGNKLIAGGSGTDSPAAAIKLDDLIDVAINALNLDNLSFLVYDFTQKQWVNKNPSEVVFEGATSTSMGRAGLVPAPSSGQENLFLKGDGSWAPATCSAALYEVIVDSDETHDDAIARIIGSNTILNGDVVVVKEEIANNKYQHTSYIYSQSVKKWIAMDGNYDASNVYFNSDFVFTEAIGTVTIPSTGSTVVTAEGKNVQEFLASLFAAARDPIVTAPSGSINFNGTFGPYEVGTKVIPQYTIYFNPGSYEFGPATDITATYAVTDSRGETNTLASGSMPEIEIDDNTNYNIGVIMTYTDGAIPVNNVGVTRPDLQLTSGTISQATSNITGYRAAFVGKDNTTGDLTSDLIRGLKCNINSAEVNGFNYDGKKEIELTADADTTRFIVAVHTGNTRAGLTNAIITSSMNADATNDYDYTENSVKVEGVNHYTSDDYDVWVYQPAKITEGETHKIILA